MLNNFKDDQFKSLVNGATDILICLPPMPEKDWVISSLALASALESLGKKVVIGCSSKIDLETVDVNKIQRAVGNRNLVVSFPYDETRLEKVAYDIDESTGRFFLIIKSKDQQPVLEQKAIDFSYTGASADLVFTFGVSSLEELGKLYADEKTLLDSAKIINIKKGGQPSDFAQIEINDFKAQSTSEVVAYLAKLLGAKPSVDHTTILFKELLEKTQNFTSSSVTPESFELAAYLLRSGAQRQVVPAPTFRPTPPPMPSNGNPFPPLIQRTPNNYQDQRPKADNQFVPSQPQNNQSANQPINKNPNVPQDWQGPKIFRAGQPRPDLLK